jgi:hypothetical protein
VSDQFGQFCNLEALMPDFAHWSVFFAATIILLLIPGPSVLYVVARGIDQGYRAAVFSSLGLGLGDLLQVVCAAVGLSALLASSVVFFTIAKYAGAAYLIFLGVRRLLEKNALVLPTSAGGEHLPRRIPLVRLLSRDPSPSTPKRRCSSLRSFLSLSLRMPDQHGFRFFSSAALSSLLASSQTPSMDASVESCLVP